jgi:hypothetical protein
MYIEGTHVEFGHPADDLISRCAWLRVPVSKILLTLGSLYEALEFELLWGSSNMVPVTSQVGSSSRNNPVLIPNWYVDK